MPFLRKKNALLAIKTSKSMCRLGRCSVLNAQNLEKLRGKKFIIVPFLLDILAFFCCVARKIDRLLDTFLLKTFKQKETIIC